MKTKTAAKTVRIYTDGAGAWPNGKGSAYAWIRTDTQERQVHKQDGLTNNQAEYLGLRSALEALPKGSTAHIFTDSQLVCYQFNGQYKVLNPILDGLLSDIRAIIADRNLKVTVSWIPREKNVAGKLLGRK